MSQVVTRLVLIAAIAHTPQVARGAAGVVSWAGLAPQDRVIVVDRRPAPEAARFLAALSRRVRPVPIAALYPLMAQRDAQRGVVSAIEGLQREAQQALLRLRREEAERALGKAVMLVNQSFVAHYRPALAAEVLLWQGIAALARAAPSEARELFARALQYDPRLTLGAFFSPQVRAAFTEAGRGAGQTAMAPGVALRLFEIEPRAAAVLHVGIAGHRQVAVLTLRRSGRSWEATEAGSDASEAGAEELVSRVVRHAGLAPLAALRLAATAPVPPPARRPRWYGRWYVWVAVGAVAMIGATTAMIARRETVDVSLRWGK